LALKKIILQIFILSGWFSESVAFFKSYNILQEILSKLLETLVGSHINSNRVDLSALLLRSKNC
jgi:hypothetical protein